MSKVVYVHPVIDVIYGVGEKPCHIDYVIEKGTTIRVRTESFNNSSEASKRIEELKKEIEEVSQQTDC